MPHVHAPRPAGRTPARIFLLSVIALLSPTLVHAASSADGFWRTADGDGLVEIRPCGAALCGYLVDHGRLHANPNATDIMNVQPAMRSRPMMEMLLLEGFAGGPDRWGAGKIYNPQNGKTYSGSLSLIDADQLKVVGCLIRPLCGSQIWRRAKP